MEENKVHFRHLML